MEIVEDGVRARKTAIYLNFSFQTLYTLLLLANEDNKLLEEMVESLILQEDRMRHIEYPPYEGERRVKCLRGDCPETQERKTGPSAPPYED